MGFRRNKGDDDKKPTQSDKAKGGDKKPDDGGRRSSPFARGGSDDKPTDDKAGGGRNPFSRNRDSSPSTPADTSSRSPFSRTSTAPPPASNEPGGRTFGASGRSPGGTSGDEAGGRTFGAGGRSPSGGTSEEAGGRTFGSSGSGSSPFGSPSSGSRPASGSTPFGSPSRTPDKKDEDEGGGRSAFGRSPSPSSSGGGSQPSSFSRSSSGGSTPFSGSSRSTDTDRRDEDESGGRSAFGRSPSPSSGGGSQPSSGSRSPSSGSTPFGSSSSGGSRPASGGASDSSSSNPFGRSSSPPSSAGSGSSSSFGRTPAGSTPAPGGRTPAGSTPASGGSSPFGRSSSAPSTPSSRPSSVAPGGRTPIGADTARKDAKGRDDKKGRDKKAEEKERKPLFNFGRGGDKATTQKDDKKKDDRSAFAKRSEPVKATKATTKAAPLPRVENLPRNVTSPITLDRKLDLLGGALIAVAAILAFGWLQTQFATTEARGFMAQVDSYAAQLFGIGRFIWIIVCGYIGGWLILRHFGKMFDIDYFRLLGFILTYLAFVTTLQWLDLFFLGRFVSGFPEVQYFPDKEALEVASDALWQTGSGGGIAGHISYIWFHRQLGDWVFEAFLFFWWGLGIFFAFDLSFEKIAAGMIARRHARQAQQVERVKVPAAAPALTVAAATVGVEAVSNRRKKGADVAGRRTEAPADGAITADTDGDAPQRQERSVAGRRTAEPVVSSNTTPKRRGLLGRGGRQEIPADAVSSAAAALLVATDAPTVEQNAPKRGGLLGRGGRTATPETPPVATPSRDVSGRSGRRLDELTPASSRTTGEQPAVSTSNTESHPGRRPLTPQTETTTPVVETDAGKRQGLFERSGRRQPPDATTESTKSDSPEQSGDTEGKRRGLLGRGGRSAAADMAAAGAVLASTAATDKAEDDKASGGRRSLFGRGGSTPADSIETPAGRKPVDAKDKDGTISLPGRRPTDTPASSDAAKRRPSLDLGARRAPAPTDATSEQPVSDDKGSSESVLPRRTPFDIPATRSTTEADSIASIDGKAEQAPIPNASPARRSAFDLTDRKLAPATDTASTEGDTGVDTAPKTDVSVLADASPVRHSPFDMSNRKPTSDADESSSTSRDSKPDNGQSSEVAPARPTFDLTSRRSAFSEAAPTDEASKGEDPLQPTRRTPFDFTGRRPPTPESEEGKGNGEKAIDAIAPPSTRRPIGVGDDDEDIEEDTTAAARPATGERRSPFASPATDAPAAPTGLFTRRREPTDSPPADLPGRQMAGQTLETTANAEIPPTNAASEIPIEPAKPRGVSFSAAPTEALGRRLPTKEQEQDAEDLNVTKDVDASPDTPAVVEAVEPAAAVPEPIKTEPLSSTLTAQPEPTQSTEGVTATPPAAPPVARTPEARPPVPTSPAPAAKSADPAKASPVAPEPAPTGAARWQPPNFRELLQEGSNQDIDQTYLLEQARIIEDTLDSFGAPGRVVEVNTGPVITQFGVEPNYIEKRGGSRSRVKVAAIASLDKDLALALAAKSIRIEAPVPGKGYVGIEVPNSEAALVSLRDVMDSEQHDKLVAKSKLTISLGKRVDGGAVSADLTQMPHLLIAGATGSGKSICVNAVIACLLLQNTPAELQFIMVDPKRVELAGYNGIPHLVAPVVVDLERIVGVLKWVQREMDDRYKRFSAAGARHIIDYNSKLPVGQEKMPYLVVIIDELADLMMLAPDETERLIARLAQMARATGIHLIISTQRPSVDVVTGLIKANFPARIAFAVASSVDSRVILDQPGAEKLLGRGDMLYQAPDAPAPLRMQGVYVSDPELNRVTHYWKSTAALSRGGARPPITKLSVPETPPLPRIVSRSERVLGDSSSSTSARPTSRQPDFWQQVKEAETDNDDDVPSGEDELYDEAVELVQQRRKASISMLQRHFRIGYTRAARLIDIMEEHGVVGPAESGAKPREVLIDGDGKEIDYDDEEDDE